MGSPGKLSKDLQPWGEDRRARAIRTPNALKTKDIFKVMGTFPKIGSEGEDPLCEKNPRKKDL
jgi:hypothetical protein